MDGSFNLYLRFKSSETWVFNATTAKGEMHFSKTEPDLVDPTEGWVLFWAQETSGHILRLEYGDNSLHERPLLFWKV